MDKSEGHVLSGIPAAAVTLSLTRSIIKMEHSRTWMIDKTNTVYDLIVCLEGEAEYRIGNQHFHLTPGDAMLIPKDTRFIGWNPGKRIMIGIAQHFSLDLFNQHDLIAQMDLQPMVRLSRWAMLEPLARHYRQISPPSSTTLMQFHLFMVLLMEFIDDAFVAWKSLNVGPMNETQGLPLAVMLAATQISAAPLDPEITERVVKAAPYNADYFQREFRQRIGLTPRKFQEFKRMERAMQLLQAGRSISETAAAIGYADVYYFSRMFRRYIGTSPRGYQRAMQQHRDGHYPRGEEDGQILYPILPHSSQR
ncbi:AraC family transcriptional regulator [Consotaella aegiceratis]|uniref:AraC family transcriptional regulator n=1 Tax=Consotaella aegiceratis TaxID=3097961 RepID=UPI002F3E4834